MFGAVSVQPDSRILWTMSEGPGPFLLGLPRAIVSVVLALGSSAASGTAVNLGARAAGQPRRRGGSLCASPPAAPS
jgi:hypothetical protein